jgi:hypothetical protein
MSSWPNTPGKPKSTGYDPVTQMHVFEPRDPDPERLRFLRWLMEERRRLDHGQVVRRVRGKDQPMTVPDPCPYEEAGESCPDPVFCLETRELLAIEQDSEYVRAIERMLEDEWRA